MITYAIATSGPGRTRGGVGPVDDDRPVRRQHDVAGMQIQVHDHPGGPERLRQALRHGRAANVYALDDDRVLRRYRTPYSCAAEADLMRYLRRVGYPVPAVLAVDGGDLVMERLHGRDMLADLASRPWRIAAHARVPAALHDQLHQMPPVTWMRRFAFRSWRPIIKT
jgi:Phosphotransferase enzyme family